MPHRSNSRNRGPCCAMRPRPACDGWHGDVCGELSALITRGEARFTCPQKAAAMTSIEAVPKSKSRMSFLRSASAPDRCRGWVDGRGTLEDHGEGPKGKGLPCPYLVFGQDSRRHAPDSVRRDGHVDCLRTIDDASHWKVRSRRPQAEVRLESPARPGRKRRSAESHDRNSGRSIARGPGP